MKTLVTGGAGFIGSHLVEELVKQGHEVRVIDNFATGKRENLKDIKNDIELIEGDIRCYHLVNKAVNKIDVIFHEAALPSVPRSVADPITSNQVNIDGTLNILEAAKDNNVRRVIFASSSSVYGDTPELPKHEGMKLNPLSPYALNKLTGEKYCNIYTKLYGLETVSLRYFNVFGPRQDPNSQYSAVIPKFIKIMTINVNGFGNNQPVIYGDGDQSRDFTYVDNVVKANILAATKQCTPGIAMNCACHGKISLNDLVCKINKLIGKEIKPIYTFERKGDIKHSFASIDLIMKELGYVPHVSFDDGLEKVVMAYSGIEKHFFIGENQLVIQ